MSVLAIMIPISLFLALGFLGAYIWVVNTGQFDDLVTPANEILIDEQTNGDDNDEE